MKKRNLLSVENYHFDVSYIYSISNIEDDENCINIIYNGDECIINCKDKNEQKTIFQNIIKEMIDAEMVLLYDNDRDVINFSNVVLFEEPIFNKEKKEMTINFTYINNSQYSIILYENETIDTIDIIELKMKKIFDELFNIWLNNKSGMFKPFHQIDFE